MIFSLSEALTFCASCMDTKKPLIFINEDFLIAEGKLAQVSVRMKTGLKPCMVDCFKFIEVLNSANGALSFVQTENNLTVTSSGGTSTLQTFEPEKTATQLFKFSKLNSQKIITKLFLSELEEICNILKISKGMGVANIGHSVFVGNRYCVGAFKSLNNLNKISFDEETALQIKKILKSTKSLNLLKITNDQNVITVWTADGYFTFKNFQVEDFAQNAKNFVELISKGEFQKIPADFFKKLKSTLKILEDEIVTLHSNTLQGRNGEVFASFNLNLQFVDSKFFIKQLLACEKLKPTAFKSENSRIVFKFTHGGIVIMALAPNQERDAIEEAGAEFNESF